MVKKKKQPLCANCGHKKSLHDHGVNSCCWIDRDAIGEPFCRCPGWKSKTQAEKEKPRRVETKPKAFKSDEAMVHLSTLVGRDKKGKITLRKIGRLLAKLDRIERAAHQVVAHSHSVGEDKMHIKEKVGKSVEIGKTQIGQRITIIDVDERALKKFLAERRTPFRITLDELERSL